MTHRGHYVCKVRALGVVIQEVLCMEDLATLPAPPPPVALPLLGALPGPEPAKLPGTFFGSFQEPSQRRRGVSRLLFAGLGVMKQVR